MPADADLLLCEYYLRANLNEKSKDSINEESTNETAVSNQLDLTPNADHIDANESMDLLKAKFTNSFKAKSPLLSKESDIADLELNNNNNLFVKNSFWLDLNWCKIRKSGIGLLNLGNNCYLNATLQCLAYTPPLSQWLVFRPHSPMCKFKQFKGFCSLCEVEKIIYDIFNSCNGCVKPNSLCFNIKKISNVFGVGTQEDASEFFTTLLESMARSIKFAVNLELKQSASSGSNNFQTKNKTILDDIFSFQFRSRITCCNCGKLSDTYENTNTWPVDVKYVQDIRKGMVHFLREEVLDGDNRYNCDKCNKKVRATKKYSIKTAPNILVVQLKRFDFTYAGKLTHYVSYPEILNLKSFMSDNDLITNTNTNSSSAEFAPNFVKSNFLNNSFNEQQQQQNQHQQSFKNTSYKLYGVLVHLGYTSHSGHYYSYVRGPNDVWYKADDQQVNTVPAQDALGQNAYILFYNRVSNNSFHQTNTNNVISSSSATLKTITQTKKDYFQSPSIPLKTSANTFSSNLINQNESIKQINLNIPKQTTNENLLSEKPSAELPLEKFKSTFVAVESIMEKAKSSIKLKLSSEIDSPDEKNSKTLNYDQVLRIKKLNKRNLKLINRKKQLDELNQLKSEDKESKKVKKKIKKLKKQIKKDETKIKKLEKRNKKYLKNDLNLSDDSASSSFNNNKDTKSQTNSLSLLKQYHSSSSSEESTPFSSPKSHSRSSISSSCSSILSESSASTSTSSESKWTPAKTLKRKFIETEPDSDSTAQNPSTNLINNTANNIIQMPKMQDEKTETPKEKLKEDAYDKQNIHENETQFKKFKQTDQNNYQPKQTVEHISTKIQINIRPEIESNSNSKSFNQCVNKDNFININNNTNNSNKTNSYLNNTNYKFNQKNNNSQYNCTNSSQYSWNNNNKYKYSHPHYQNNHYSNYKNKFYNSHFNRY